MSGAYRPLMVGQEDGNWDRNVRFNVPAIFDKAGKEYVDYPG